MCVAYDISRHQSMSWQVWHPGHGQVLAHTDATHAGTLGPHCSQGCDDWTVCTLMHIDADVQHGNSTSISPYPGSPVLRLTAVACRCRLLPPAGASGAVWPPAVSAATRTAPLLMRPGCPAGPTGHLHVGMHMEPGACMCWSGLVKLLYVMSCYAEYITDANRDSSQHTAAST